LSLELGCGAAICGDKSQIVHAEISLLGRDVLTENEIIIVNVESFYFEVCHHTLHARLASIT
jgi:hypothetical protein